MLKRLLYMNGLAILAVVLNHARVWGVIAMFYWTDRYRPVSVPNFDQVGSLESYALLGFTGLIQFAIPTFLFVSGFFVAIATGKNKSTIPWNVVFTRIKFLVIPYLIWFFIMSGVLAVNGERYGLLQYVSLLLTGYIQGPYYFVPMLIQLYLLSPFIVPLAKSRWKLLLVCAALIQFVTQVLLYLAIFQVNSPLQEYYVLPIWFFLTRIFWFVLGIVVGLHIQSFKAFFERTRWVFLVLTIAFLFINTWERSLISQQQITIPVETTMGSLYAISFIFAILGFSNVHLPLTSNVERVGGMSFGIYLTHAAAQEYSSRLIYHVAPSLLEYSVLFTMLIFIIGLGIPNFLMETARRLPVRRYYQYIFG